MDVFRKKIDGAAPKPTAALLALRERKARNYHRCIPVQKDRLLQVAKDTDLSTITGMDMLPVEPATKAKLYDGITHDRKGRYQYRHERYQIKPEEKFKYPFVDSWVYGWHLDDAMKKQTITTPRYVRTHIVEETFYTRTGIPELAVRD